MDSLEEALEAFGWGLLSAVSLPMGAVTGLYTHSMTKKWNSALMAYGAGALLFALTIELFGIGIFIDQEHHRIDPLIGLGVGCIFGALLYIFCNWILENRGAFLRSSALREKYFRGILEQRLSRQSPDERRRGVRWRGRVYPSAYIDLDESVFDDISPPVSIPMTTVTTHAGAGSDTTEKNELSEIKGEDENEGSNDVEEGNTNDNEREQEPLGGGPLPGDDSSETHAKSTHSESASSHEHSSNETSEHGGQPLSHNVGLAIWLGILIDGVPESLVIGILSTRPSGISYTFLAGVFLSNFPEALSSSRIMLEEGLSKLWIIILWVSIMLITGIGAAVGALILRDPEADEMTEIFARGMEGLAAGAMLVMISQTAVPEAFRHAGNLVGFAILCGFLSAYLVKLFERPEFEQSTSNASTSG